MHSARKGRRITQADILPDRCCRQNVLPSFYGTAMRLSGRGSYGSSGSVLGKTGNLDQRGAGAAGAEKGAGDAAVYALQRHMHAGGAVRAAVGRLSGGERQTESAQQPVQAAVHGRQGAAGGQGAFLDSDLAGCAGAPGCGSAGLREQRGTAAGPEELHVFGTFLCALLKVSGKSLRYE